jgi:hypothetical protein
MRIQPFLAPATYWKRAAQGRASKPTWQALCPEAARRNSTLTPLPLSSEKTTTAFMDVSGTPENYLECTPYAGIFHSILFP